MESKKMSIMSKIILAAQATLGRGLRKKESYPSLSLQGGRRKIQNKRTNDYNPAVPLLGSDGEKLTRETDS